jgi:L-glyceraldehyde 3-phosphate reductase
MGALERIVRSGKALYAGVSNYPGARTRAASELMAGRNWNPITIHQPYYNMLGRGIETDLIPVAGELGVGVIAFSPLANGFLTSKYLNGIPADSRAATDFYSGNNVRKRVESGELLGKLRKLNDIAAARGQSLAQMALAWILRLPEITSALIGASKVSQIEDNVAALSNLEFSAEELQSIEDLLK